MEIYIVDEKDNQITTKHIDQVELANIIYRAAGIWLFNNRNEVLIAQRALNKEHLPGTWGASAAGIVENGETYIENILKEAEEEIGITLSAEDLITGPKLLVVGTSPDRRYFIQWFFAKYNGSTDDLTIQEDEVADVKWINREELIAAAERNPEQFCDASPEVINALKDYETDNT